MVKHGGDCDGTWCSFCGCCQHGEDERGCRAADAPDGMRCPNSECGCEGGMGHDKPVKPPPAYDEADDAPEPTQLHQELSLFPITEASK